mgnify:CR=1 FL=1
MDILFDTENRKYWAVKNDNFINDIIISAECLTQLYDWDVDGVIEVDPATAHYRLPSSSWTSP